jgi:hypothetical protein
MALTSGFKVNQTKTEWCNKKIKNLTPVLINLVSVQIRSKKSINILGVIFDS